jgi:type I restriction enzyme S subunit
MRDSGVEWIGEVPEHWEVKKLKYLMSSTFAGPFGSSLKIEDYTKSGYRVYGQEQVIPADFSIGDYYIGDKKFKKMRRYEVQSGDILISCVGSFGKIAMFPEQAERGIINPRLICMRPKAEFLPMYISNFLLSPICFSQFEKMSRGGTMGVINLGLLSSLVVTVPPIKEQLAVASRCEEIKSRFANAINKVQRDISAYLDLKQTIISEAVTGKIKI